MFSSHVLRINLLTDCNSKVRGGGKGTSTLTREVSLYTLSGRGRIGCRWATSVKLIGWFTPSLIVFQNNFFFDWMHAFIWRSSWCTRPSLLWPYRLHTTTHSFLSILIFLMVGCHQHIDIQFPPFPNFLCVKWATTNEPVFATLLEFAFVFFYYCPLQTLNQPNPTLLSIFPYSILLSLPSLLYSSIYFCLYTSNPCLFMSTPFL